MSAPRFSSRLPTHVLVVGGLLCAPAASALNVRVLVLAAPSLTVRVPVAAPPATPLPVYPAVPTPAPLQFAAWRVGVQGSGAGARLTLNGQDSGNATLYLPPTPGSVVEIGGKAYRGGVFLRTERGGVQAINVVNVEDYLRGVVASEMPSSWPAAALAAQAVIARTYVAARVNPALPFDTCATESCQVYTGIASEKPATDAAIAATAGQVVAYAGKAASTYFSSDSGGFTASSAEVWGKDVPYLTAKADPFSAGSPRARWRIEVPLSKVQEVAGRYGVRVGILQAVTVNGFSASGRPQQISFTGASGVARISGAEAGGFVRSLGAVSSRATLSGLNPLIVEGAGAGHGVGLSQYGALGLARQGYDHLHVLGFYYPGTSLSALAGGVEGTRPRLALARPLPSPASLNLFASHPAAPTWMTQ
ncbi:SpoIID/LytB domain-containing protein [Deinococcus sp. QL22]|uniref:SpoIID/LytB domain-containing protein n=1 Tax=Deinococcus sp. QL22 TaxID=2939437 RepID=UPI002017CC9F|nr:SpoIID/LytB domain-containing protein [Deinococcus sp. QL22]UQN05132.1 SpoIID/LytB domain-containing protein [Deinococcus sp. QL22]